MEVEEYVAIGGNWQSRGQAGGEEGKMTGSEAY